MSVEHPILEEELMAYVDCQLSDREASRVDEHISECSQCASAVAEAVQLSERMIAWKIEESPARLNERVMAELPSMSRAGWWTPGRKWFYGLAAGLATVAVLFSLATPSLLRSRQAAQSSGLAERSLPVPAEQAGPTGTSAVQTPSGPMVIRTMNLNLITKEFDGARSRIDAIVRQYQGYIDHLNVRANTGSARSLSATLRLPAGQADSGLNELRKLGKLTDESQNTSDVTSQYVDLAARLSNARSSEQRLLALLRERAGNLKDVIEMERQISLVRESIERMEAQQKDLNNKVQFVTIQLELAEEYRAELDSPAPSTGSQLRNAAVEGFQSATETIVGMVLFVLRYGLVLVIWSVALGALTVLVLRLRHYAIRLER